MKLKRCHYLPLYVGIALILVHPASYAQSSSNSQFPSYADRKARESETQGGYYYGIISDEVTVTASNGNKVPVPKGFVLKIVGEAFDNNPTSVIGYIATKVSSAAFSLPRSNVSLIRKGSDQWTQVEAQYEQAVTALESANQQAATGSRQTTSALPKQIPVLSKNDRTRMLYVLRQEKYISSIRAGEALSDDQIMQLYTKALEQQRLRGIESAVRSLQR